MNSADIYMLAVAIIGSLIFYLQAYKIFTKGSAKDVSVGGFTISLFTSINWLVYGIVKSNHPMILSGSLCTVGSILVLVGVGIAYLKK